MAITKRTTDTRCYRGQNGQYNYYRQSDNYLINSVNVFHNQLNLNPSLLVRFNKNITLSSGIFLSSRPNAIS